MGGWRQAGRRILEDLRHQYLIPQAAIRVWGVGEHMADHDFARAVSADAKAFAASS